MPLETATYINDLAPANPAHTDGLSQADSHMRLLKATLKATFPGVTGVLTSPTGGFLSPTDTLAFSFASEGGLGISRTAPAVMSVTGTLRGNGTVPAGFILDFGGTAPPAGWLVCDGQAVSRTTYADLFTAISTSWGVGDGSTTFNVPPLVNRFRRHRNDVSLAGPVGTLQGPLNLTHTHGVVGTTGIQNANHTHAFGGTTGDDSPDHSHTYTAVLSPAANVISYGGGLNNGTNNTGTGTSSGASSRHVHTYSGTTAGLVGDHGHVVNFTSGATGDTNEARPYSATVLTCIKI